MLAMTRDPDKANPDARAGATLGHLAELLGGALRGDPDVSVGGVQQDSRRVLPGDLFAALRGATADGLAYAPAAVERGAAALLVDRGREVDAVVPVIAVDDSRAALPLASAEVYGRPTERMQVVGITGTNGKTTTAHILEQALSGVRVGIIGTLGYRFEQLEGPLIHTSPEADELQRIAATMLERGATHLVMEVSSIALAAQRVAEVAFDVAVFTNLTQDHIGWHGSMHNYATAKERLFVEHRPSTCVVNIDDSFGVQLAETIAAAGYGRLIRVSAQPGEPAPDQVRPSAAPVWVDGGVQLALWVGEVEVELTAPLVGAHNVSNLVCALGVVLALGLDADHAAAALASLRQVPGRLERCSGADDDIIGLVDYAHTPDALRSVLASVRVPGASVWCVFGCGGDRDASKRGPMGEAVAAGADVAIVTSDNPRSEDPQIIADAILAGLRGGGASDVRVELDRRKAIALAVDAAARGDVVLVAGKGHEPHQVIADQVVVFDDRLELREALSKRRREG